MTGERGPATAGEQAEPIGQAVGQHGDGQRTQPGRGQLDGERHAVQRPAYPYDGLDVAPGEHEARGAIEQQAYGGKAGGDRLIRTHRRESQRLTFAEAMRRIGSGEFPAVAALYSSEDQLEGARAFTEKRRPNWKGR